MAIIKEAIRLIFQILIRIDISKIARSPVEYNAKQANGYLKRLDDIIAKWR